MVYTKIILFVLALGFLLQAPFVSAPPTSEQTFDRNFCQSFKVTKERVTCESLHRCFAQYKGHLDNKHIEDLFQCAQDLIGPDMTHLHYRNRHLESPDYRFVELLKVGGPKSPGKIDDKDNCRNDLESGCRLDITVTESELYRKLTQSPPLQSKFHALMTLLGNLYKKEPRNGQESTLGDRCYWKYIGKGITLYYKKVTNYDGDRYTIILPKGHKGRAFGFDELLEQTYYCREFAVCVEQFQKGTSYPGEVGAIAAADRFFTCTRHTFTHANPVRRPGQSFSTVPLIEPLPEPTLSEATVDAAKLMANTAKSLVKAAACGTVLRQFCDGYKNNDSPFTNNN